MPSPVTAPRRARGSAHRPPGTGEHRARPRGPVRPGAADRPASDRDGRAARFRAALRDDSGASAVEFVMLTPIMFFLIFGAVQFALYSFAADVAKAAAQAGAREARREADVSAGWQDSARGKARDYVRQLAGPGLLSNVSVPVGRNGDMVSVTVTGDAPAILPGMSLRVTAVSEGPVERFVPDGG